MQTGSILRLIALLALSLYVGGAMTMEIVLRHAQEDLPGPQTAITCKVSGDRWKWISLCSLAVTGASIFALAALRRPLLPVAWAGAYLAGLAGLAACWTFLAWVLTRMSFGAHPALSLRPDPGMPSDQFEETRQALKVAIRRMDRLLRAELVVALAMTVFASVVLQFY